MVVVVAVIMAAARTNQNFQTTTWLEIGWKLVGNWLEIGWKLVENWLENDGKTEEMSDHDVIHGCHHGCHHGCQSE